MNEIHKNVQTDFAKEVKTGLTSKAKYLASRFIYDAKGDALFKKIMELPEYYLTNCEFQIIEKFKNHLLDLFNHENGFDLIELGAGDGKKTKILLEHFVKNNLNFNYLPIDISGNILDCLEKDLKDALPLLKFKTLKGNYFEILHELNNYNNRKKVILVLGSNIGNLKEEKAIKFLTEIQKAMDSKDMLFIGFDQKKNPKIIWDAYNDKEGVTVEFNKNLLHRINVEFEGDFDADNFIHWESYNPETGTASSYLISTIQHSVNIKALDLKVDFKKWETIHTEISQKYDDEMVEDLAKKSGLSIQFCFQDEKDLYKNYILMKL